ncbi:MAG: hypothetical protein NT051_06360 [Candidatus Micrarchaeota archaeon]|nr:hypothetical protein [Candidatus Micrarchaeota archaeon]
MAGKKIEEAWSATTSIVLGEPLEGIDKFGRWLFSGMPGWREVKTKSGQAIVPCYAVFPSLPDSKVALMADLKEVSGIQLDIGGKPSAERLASQMGKKGKFIVDLAEGENLDVERCSIYKNLSVAHMCLDCFYSKYISYDWFCDYNDRIFGCQFTFSSQFCIKCYHSSSLSRCFEMDSCSKCSDSYFCHDCENLQNCMFCFNVNNLRYAVANTVVGKEKFELLKKEVLSRTVRELRKNGAASLSIYNF